MGKKQRFPGFKQCMALIRTRSAALREDGFHWLLPYAAPFVEELIAEFRAETKDRGLRCWLLELIGEARDSRALPLFIEHVQSPDESLRMWAVTGLRLLDTPEARRVLFDAKVGNTTPLDRRGG